MATMPLVGYLLSKVEARWLIAFGLVVVSFSLNQMSHFDLQISYRVAVFARLIQAGGLGFLFVPMAANGRSFKA